MKKKRKGQVALEFLMTYGWAFLIILVVIGAFIYFDVLNPAARVPSSCTLQAGMMCNAYAIYNDGIQIEIRNGFGEQINITGGRIIDEFDNTRVSDDCTVIDVDGVVNNREYGSITCPEGTLNLNTGDRFQGAVEITFQRGSGTLASVHTGSISGTVGGIAP